MEEWKEYKIGDVCKIKRGASPRPIQQFLSNKGMPWVKIADATASNSMFLDSTKEYIIEEGVSKSVTVLPGTLIVSNSATPGLPKVIRIKACVHDGWLVISDFKGVLRDFMYYKFVDIRRNLSNQANGSVFQNLKTDIVRDYSINIPSLKTQEKIVSILKSLDDKIEINRKINENLEQQAQALFKSWFVDFEPFKNGEFVESELGMIPKGWRVTSIGDLPLVVTDYVANGSFASLKENVKLYQEEEYAVFIRNTDLKSGEFCVYVDKHSYDFLSKSRLYGGEIIISNVGDVGSVYLCPHLNKPMTLGNNIIMVKSEEEAINVYLYILFRWSYGQGLIQSITGGSAQPKFNKTDFKSLKVIMPSNDILVNYGDKMLSMMNIIEANKVESRRLAELRDTLLPKLMSGELKVNEIEK